MRACMILPVRSRNRSARYAWLSTRVGRRVQRPSHHAGCWQVSGDSSAWSLWHESTVTTDDRLFFGLAPAYLSSSQKCSTQMTHPLFDYGRWCRAVTAFVALPGMVAFFIPLFIVHPTWPDIRATWIGLLPFCTGTTVLIWCVQAFYNEGKGTLAPWSPPLHLVTSGLYRHSRNPMYAGVLLILAGWAILYASTTLLLYALLVMMAFHLRIVHGEEPWLARTHGEAWRTYASHVPRWVWRI